MRDIEKEIERTKKWIAYSLINELKEEIILKGGLAPTIETDDIFTAIAMSGEFSFKLLEDDDFCPVSIWNYITEKYSVEASTDMAHTEYAESLIEALNLAPRHNPSVKQVPKAVGGMVSFSIKASLCPYAFGDKKEFGFDSRREIESFCLSLSKFCTWADDESTARELKFLVNNRSFDGHIVSREKTELTNITLITFHTKLEVRLSKELATKFQLYLSKYGAKRFSQQCQ